MRANVFLCVPRFAKVFHFVLHVLHHVRENIMAKQLIKSWDQFAFGLIMQINLENVWLSHHKWHRLAVALDRELHFVW